MTTYNDPAANPPERRTSPALVAAAWLVVCVPAAWGVYQTIKKSIPLFRPPAAHATAAPAAPATTAPAR
jgi:peptidoglycan/LPS O-acetylase OafA/YrhL